jgi:hypothetical protein
MTKSNVRIEITRPPPIRADTTRPSIERVALLARALARVDEVVGACTAPVCVFADVDLVCRSQCNVW